MTTLLYRHRKTGNLYVRIGEAINCTNDQDGQRMVIYQRQGEAQVFVREAVEFAEKFEPTPGP